MPAAVRVDRAGCLLRYQEQEPDDPNGTETGKRFNRPGRQAAGTGKERRRSRVTGKANPNYFF